VQLRSVVAVLIAAWVAGSAAPVVARQAKPAANPVIVLDTVKGAIEIRLHAADAPKSVDHILALVRRHFYRGLRFHRVTASLVQWGDPQTRSVARRGYWGSGGSGTFINAFEVSKRLTHVRGAVGLAHSGNPMAADSQLYIMKAPSPGLDGKHAVIGQVIAGMAVVDKIQEVDLIRLVTVKGEAPK
jgi:peptidylprolyl isomerase